MTTIHAPQTGKRISANFGRDVARSINALNITGGQGVRVTKGPNGVTISAVGSKPSGSSGNDTPHPFELSIRTDDETGKQYPIVYCPTGSGQTDVLNSVCENDATEDDGWYDIAESFSDDKGVQSTLALDDITDKTDIAWDENNKLRVYAFFHIVKNAADDTEELKCYIQFSSTRCAFVPDEEHVGGIYEIGSFAREEIEIDGESKSQFVYSVSDQLITSVILLSVDDSEERPFKLAVYTDDEGAIWPIVYCPYCSVQVDETPNGDGYGIVAGTFLNGEMSGAGPDWLLVCDLDPDGKLVRHDCDNISWSETDGTAAAYLFVSEGSDSEGYDNYECYVVLGDGTWPSYITEESRVAKVYLGSFAKTEAEDADGNSTTVYSVASQVVNDAQIVRTGGEEGLYPFKLKRVNEGTEDAPNWKTVVYLPADAVQHSDATKTTNLCVAATDVGDEWYYVDDSDETSATVYLSMLYWSPYTMIVSGGKWNYRIRFIVTTKKEYSLDLPADVFDEVTADSTGVKRIMAHRQYGIAVGSFDETQNTATNVLRSAYVIEFIRKVTRSVDDSTETPDSAGNAGGGGGITLLDAGTQDFAQGVVSAGKTSEEAVTGVFKRYNYLAPEAVGVEDTPSLVTLKDYLDSAKTTAEYEEETVVLGVDEETGEQITEVRKTFKEYMDEPSQTYGANISTKNFAALCLQKNDTQNVIYGGSSVAARADHRHYSDDIYYLDNGEKKNLFSTIDSFLEYLESLESDDKSEIEQENEDPDGNRLVRFDDLLKENTSTQGADGIGKDKASEQEPPTSMTDNEASEDVEIFDLPGYILKEAYLEENGLYQGEWVRSEYTPKEDGSSGEASTDTEGASANATSLTIASGSGSGTSSDGGTDDNTNTGHGFTYTVCCGVKYHEGGVYLIFREMSVDRFGTIYKMSSAKFALQVLAPQIIA